jgi:hypothetical protein
MRRNGIMIATILMVALTGLTQPSMAQEQAQTEATEHITVVPADLDWKPVPSLPPGARMAVIEGDMSKREPFTLRLRFPSDYTIPAHTHPTTERVTVLSGTLYLAAGHDISRDAAVALPPGSVTVMPPRMEMAGFTKDEPVEIQLNGIGPWGMDLLDP